MRREVFIRQISPIPLDELNGGQVFGQRPPRPSGKKAENLNESILLREVDDSSQGWAGEAQRWAIPVSTGMGENILAGKEGQGFVLKLSRSKVCYFGESGRLFNASSLPLNLEVEGFQVFNSLFQTVIALLQLLDVFLQFLIFFGLLL